MRGGHSPGGERRLRECDWRRRRCDGQQRRCRRCQDFLANRRRAINTHRRCSWRIDGRRRIWRQRRRDG